jgi:hypothetical protein
MTVRDDLEMALTSWTTDGRVADTAADTIMDRVIAVLRRRFPNIPRAEFELLLAGERGHAENLLDSLITGTVSLDNAVDVVASRFFGDD